MIENRKQVAKEIADFFNKLIEIDPVALSTLFTFRVPVNDAMKKADMPVMHEGDDEYTLGHLGLLNGFLGPYKGKGVMIAVIENGKVIKFINRLEEDDE